MKKTTILTLAVMAILLAVIWVGSRKPAAAPLTKPVAVCGKAG